MEFKDVADKIFKATVYKTYEKKSLKKSATASQYLPKVYEKFYEIDKEFLAIERVCSQCPECIVTRREIVLSYVLDAIREDEQDFGNSLEENIDQVIEFSKVVYESVSKIPAELVNHSALSKPE